MQAAGRTHAAPTPEETSIAAPPALQDGPSLVTFLVGLFALGQVMFLGVSQLVDLGGHLCTT